MDNATRLVIEHLFAYVLFIEHLFEKGINKTFEVKQTPIYKNLAIVPT